MTPRRESVLAYSVAAVTVVVLACAVGYWYHQRKVDEAARAEFQQQMKAREAQPADFDAVLQPGEVSRWIDVPAGYAGYSWNTEPTPDPSVVEYVLRDDLSTIRSSRVSKALGAEGRLVKVRFRNNWDKPNRIQFWIVPPLH
jgi:hypothetical protein